MDLYESSTESSTTVVSRRRKFLGFIKRSGRFIKSIFLYPFKKFRTKTDTTTNNNTNTNNTSGKEYNTNNLDDGKSVNDSTKSGDSFNKGCLGRLTMRSLKRSVLKGNKNSNFLMSSETTSYSSSIYNVNYLNNNTNKYNSNYKLENIVKEINREINENNRIVDKAIFKGCSIKNFEIGNTIGTGSYATVCIAKFNKDFNLNSDLLGYSWHEEVNGINGNTGNGENIGNLGNNNINGIDGNIGNDLNNNINLNSINKVNNEIKVIGINGNNSSYKSKSMIANIAGNISSLLGTSGSSKKRPNNEHDELDTDLNPNLYPNSDKYLKLITNLNTNANTNQNSGLWSHSNRKYNHLDQKLQNNLDDVEKMRIIENSKSSKMSKSSKGSKNSKNRSENSYENENDRMNTDNISNNTDNINNNRNNNNNNEDNYLLPKNSKKSNLFKINKKDEVNSKLDYINFGSGFVGHNLFPVIKTSEEKRLLEGISVLDHELYVDHGMLMINDRMNTDNISNNDDSFNINDINTNNNIKNNNSINSDNIIENNNKNKEKENEIEVDREGENIRRLMIKKEQIELDNKREELLEPETKIVALKILNKVKIIRTKQLDHVQSEAEILSKFNHPFIVGYYGRFQDTQNLYFILEFVGGGELFYYLRKVSRFSVDTARFYCCQVLLALDFLHSQGVVYRDLKPENILLDYLGYIRLVDFGFSKLLVNENVKHPTKSVTKNNYYINGTNTDSTAGNASSANKLLDSNNTSTGSKDNSSNTNNNASFSGDNRNSSYNYNNNHEFNGNVDNSENLINGINGSNINMDHYNYNIYDNVSINGSYHNYNNNNFSTCTYNRTRDRTYTICGTCEYLAPEVFLKKGHGLQADFYSFGVLLYELLVGVPPFYSQDPQLTYNLALKQDIQFPRYIDKPTKDIIKKLLKVNPNKRLGNDIKDVYKHPFFSHINFDDVLFKRQKPPIMPLLKSKEDISNFSKYPEIWKNNKDEPSKEEQFLFSFF